MHLRLRSHSEGELLSTCFLVFSCNSASPAHTDQCKLCERDSGTPPRIPRVCSLPSPVLSQVPELLQLPGFPVRAPQLQPCLPAVPPSHYGCFLPFKLIRQKLCRAVCKANTAAFEFYSSPPSPFTLFPVFKLVPLPGPFI